MVLVTWTKLGDEFWDETANAGLSDAAARSHAEAISWLYRIESNDLIVKRGMLRRFAGTANPENAMAELVAVEFWCPVPDGWLLVHHADVVRQSLVAQQAKRQRDLRAQRAKRSREHVSGGVSADVSADVSGDTDRQTDRQQGRRSHPVSSFDPDEEADGADAAFLAVS